MTDMAVIVPTRGRPENIRKVISAWDFTNAWDTADLVLAFDQDDPAAPEYRAILDGMEVDGQSPAYQVEHEIWLPMVHKLDVTARILADRYKILGFAGDDHLPRTINWAAMYATALDQLRTGLVYGDDGYQGERLCTEWAMTSDIVRALGRMIPAPVEHMYSDVSLHELMTEAGAIRHLAQVRIEHMHPIVGKSENDDQYKRVNHRDQFAKDRALYERWQRAGKAEDLAAVRALYPDRPARPAPLKRAGTWPRPAGPTPRPAGENRSRGWGNRRPIVRSGPSRSARRESIQRSKIAPREFRKVRGATPDEIGITLADLARGVPVDQAIVELGVFQGRTALLMGWGAREGHGAHVWGFDAWDLPGNTYGEPFLSAESTARWNIQATGYSDRVTLIKAFARNAADDWEGPAVGLLFVDDDHSAEGCRAAIMAWLPHLAPDATVAVDDYGHPDWPGVAQAVDGLVDEGVLAPIERFHDQLAVTRLGGHGRVRRAVALTGEGGAFVPTESSVLQPFEPAPAQGTGAPMTPLGPPVKITTTAEAPPVEVRLPEGTPTGNEVVTANEAREVTGVDLATGIEELNISQLKALAKLRGITLGKRKDKRSEILAALRAGE